MDLNKREIDSNFFQALLYPFNFNNTEDFYGNKEIQKTPNKREKPYTNNFCNKDNTYWTAVFLKLWFNVCIDDTTHKLVQILQ